MSPGGANTMTGGRLGGLSVGLFPGPGGRRSAPEEVFDEASHRVVARVVGPGRRAGDAGGSVDLVESLVESDGEDVLFERVQGQQTVEVAVDVERIAVSAEGEVAQPQLVDGQFPAHPRGLEEAVSVVD